MMRDWFPFAISMLVFTTGDAFDGITTFMFAGSPYCQESNAFFAPFLNSPSLLFQAMLAAWFSLAGVSIIFFLVAKMLKKPWWVASPWYVVLVFFGLRHAFAGAYNASVLPLCWSSQ